MKIIDVLIGAGVISIVYWSCKGVLKAKEVIDNITTDKKTGR